MSPDDLSDAQKRQIQDAAGEAISNKLEEIGRVATMLALTGNCLNLVGRFGRRPEEPADKAPTVFVAIVSGPIDEDLAQQITTFLGGVVQDIGAGLPKVDRLRDTP